jgi:hypothetical protein
MYLRESNLQNVRVSFTENYTGKPKILTFTPSAPNLHN